MRSSLALAALSAVAISASPIVNYKRALSPSLQSILANTHNSDAYTYPTDLTRNIIPKPIHSHNDYWRDIPFYTALAAGCISIEADVWAINSTLYVGHEPSALTSTRTLPSLYIDPILSVLQRENPSTQFTPSTTRNGVFDTASTQTLYLFIDLKTSYDSTIDLVLTALDPLKNANYLTTYNGTSTTVLPGPVTVILTGSTPYTSVSDPSKSRIYFYDAPLSTLSDPTYTNLTSSQSPIASTSLLANIGYPANGSDGFGDEQLTKIRGQIANATAKGIGARYWDTPGWPVGVREGVWRVLVDEGVKLLNVDDVERAGAF